MYFFLQKTYNYESTHDIIHLNGRTAQTVTQIQLKIPRCDWLRKFV